jgi:glutathione S-transferase
MLTLCGVSISNYYNKVKLALLEKGVPFAEERVETKSKDPAVLGASPLAKVPFIKTEQGPLCESQVILDYLEAAAPQRPLFPADPYQAAKVRELIAFIELHLELVVREIYPQAFDDKPVSDETKARVRAALTKNIAAFKQLAKFAPYVAGPEFTAADCAAWPHLPLVGLATKLVYGEDLLAAAGIDWKGYTRLVGERPAAARIVAERKAEQAKLLAARG